MSSVDEFLAVGDDIREVITPVLDFASLAITGEFVSAKSFVSLVYIKRVLLTHK
jgi:hypothetical protein